MTADASPKVSRPLSPHLQVYRPQLTSGMSIFHRLTGVCLAFGLPVLVAWVVALASGPEIYAQFTECARSLVGQIMLAGWAWAFFFHFCCGVRHLFWDAGYLLSIKAVYVSGYIAIAISTIVTALVWLKMYGVAL